MKIWAVLSRLRLFSLEKLLLGKVRFLNCQKRLANPNLKIWKSNLEIWLRDSNNKDKPKKKYAQKDSAGIPNFKQSVVSHKENKLSHHVP